MPSSFPIPHYFRAADRALRGGRGRDTGIKASVHLTLIYAGTGRGPKGQRTQTLLSDGESKDQN